MLDRPAGPEPLIAFIKNVSARSEDVCAVQIDDDAQFEIVVVADIRETDDYPGIRVSLKANYPPISVPLTVDVTTGDKITPREIEYTFSTLFDDRTFSVLFQELGSSFIIILL